MISSIVQIDLLTDPDFFIKHEDNLLKFLENTP